MIFLFFTGDAVRHVRIECPNFATVVFNTESNTSEARFGSGSCLAVQADGTYTVSVVRRNNAIFKPLSLCLYCEA